MEIVVTLPDDRTHVETAVPQGDDGTVIAGPFDTTRLGKANDTTAAAQRPLPKRWATETMWA